MTSRIWLFTLIGLLAWSSCEPTNNLDSTSEGESAPTSSETGQSPDTSSQTNHESNGLTRAVGLVLGAPLPNGLELLHRDEVVARYMTEYAVELLTEFYERELDGYAMERSESIVKFESDNDDAPVIFIIQEEQGLNRVVYFGSDVDAEIIVDLNNIFNSEPTIEIGPRFRFPQGPVAVNPLWIASETVIPAPSVESDYYDVTYEERDGETIEVLVLREPVEGTIIQTPEIDEPTEGAYRSRSLGAYDRGNGQRSLRSIQEVDDSGQPLPFFGTTHYELPEGFEH